VGAPETELFDDKGFPSCFSKIESGSFKGLLSYVVNVITSIMDFLTANYYADLANR
jgi:hypothetical protein